MNKKARCSIPKQALAHSGEQLPTQTLQTPHRINSSSSNSSNLHATARQSPHLLVTSRLSSQLSAVLVVVVVVVVVVVKSVHGEAYNVSVQEVYVVVVVVLVLERSKVRVRAGVSGGCCCCCHWGHKGRQFQDLQEGHSEEPSECTPAREETQGGGKRVVLVVVVM
ncbi:hypothetical protein E2C01_081587 [Portunus trituberculatus]|uniref:Uncharacterized protein n=1 Tax=Portunus trituberculatus TaxID=210409 RepID=A0A5B7IMM8_PORTR|nr:hypothetical protein [Portunus trituberculatus]